MSSATLSGASLATAQSQFVAALPSMNTTIRFQFRCWPRRQREDAIAAARAAAWVAWHGLVRRGQDPLAVGVTGIAYNACRYVMNDRQFGYGKPGPSGWDVFHRKAQAACGFKILSLDAQANPVSGPGSGSWKDWLAEDNFISPADEAIFHLDFQAWLASLPARKREIAELLAEGHESVVVAGRVGVSPARICQVRLELAASWRAFQGEATAV